MKKLLIMISIVSFISSITFAMDEEGDGRRKRAASSSSSPSYIYEGTVSAIQPTPDEQLELFRQMVRGELTRYQWLSHDEKAEFSRILANTDQQDVNQVLYSLYGSLTMFEENKSKGVKRVK